MKYRIVQTGEGFIIQHKCLGLFWKNHRTPSYTQYSVEKRATYIGKETIKYDSIERATNALKLIKSSPIKYKGHKIECSFQLGYVPFYVDKHSYSGTDDIDRLCFCRYSTDLDLVKKAIDDYRITQKRLKEEKRKEKQDKKIINVWYED
jgi:hypothetical protein